MKAFAYLVDRLTFTRSRNEKIALIARYLADAPGADGGWALAALTGDLSLDAVKSSTVRSAIAERVDPILFKLSRDYVGDTAETAALMWPERSIGDAEPVGLSEAVMMLGAANRANAIERLSRLLDAMNAEERYALLKIVTGGMRVGVSARLAKVAFAEAFGLAVEDVEEVWHALKPPYAELFAWGRGEADKPDLTGIPHFRPFMLAQPLEAGSVDLHEYAAEWKWDGIRVQVSGAREGVRLYSRGGDDISGAFPEIVEAFDAIGVVDGELLAGGDVQGGEAGSFNALQQRLGRKSVSAKMRREYPVFLRLYDILFDGERDVRDLPWTARRLALENFAERLPGGTFDISSVVEAGSLEELGAIRDAAREAAIEGLMLKRRDSAYVAGRKAGLWYKWKRDPLRADCVMMYAQRGSGKRSSFFSDYTFGCWDANGVLAPVGKAYSGFSDEELKWLDKFVRGNTVQRFGPVREVEKTLVLEVAFDSIHESKRHKSGVAMRFPRIARIRRDKPAAEADTLETLKVLIT